MNKSTWQQWGVLLAVVGTIIINGLANALPFNGLTTGGISDRFQVYFVPAGYVFAIWGLIYLGLILLAIYQLLPAQRANPRLQRVRGALIVSCVANSAWIFLWHYELFPWTLLVMGALLVSLLVIYLRLGIGRAATTVGERWLVRVPVSIYLGWVTVATIANVTSVLENARWSGWGIAPATWAVIMLAVGALVAWAMSLTRRDAAYDLVLIWAFVGIALKHAATPLVAGAAWVATVAVVVALGVAVRAGRARGPAAR
jgi:hypothetical protein